jgi:hypothetical protein
MAARKFRFVSPGVFMKEIDNSQLPGIPEGSGPIIIGRSRGGPALKPYKVRSLEELERVFGKPLPGNQGEDPWRDGTGLLAEGYAMYAAKAYLTAGRGSDSPVTMVRLLGVAGDDAQATAEAEPGWEAKNAYGLFLIESSSTTSQTASMNLAAIFYGTDPDFKVELRGTAIKSDTVVTTGSAPVLLSATNKSTIKLSAGSGEAMRTKEVVFSYNDIRKEFNTNPVATNGEISSVVSGSLSDTYWLGESFEEAYKDFASDISANDKKAAIVLKLASSTGGMADFRGTAHQATAAQTGWFVGQDTTLSAGSFDIDNHQKLFRIVALSEGEQASKELLIGIEDLNLPREGATNRFGKFSVVVRRIGATKLEEIERYDDCDLDPTSQNFVAKKIGDQYLEWSPSEKRNKLYGEHPNVSELVRVKMNDDIVTQGGPTNPEHIPFGFYGPIRPATISAALPHSPADVNPLTASVDSWVTQTSQTLDLNGLRLYRGHGTGTITVDSTVTAVALNDKTFEYTNLSGTSQLFLFDTAKTSSLEEGIVTVGLNGVADTAAAVKDAMVAAFATVSSALKITVTAATVGSDRVITIVNSETDGSGSFSGGDLTPHTSSYTTITFAYADTAAANYEIKWPTIPLVNTASATDGFYMGASPYKMSYSTSSVGASSPGRVINRGFLDYIRRMPSYGNSQLTSNQDTGLLDGSGTEYSFKFSLDEVVMIPRPNLVGGTGSILTNGDVTSVFYRAGSFVDAAESSWSSSIIDSGGSLRTLLGIVEGFHAPLVGGSDGTDITEADPFNNRVLHSTANTANSYAYASVDRALELIKDPETVEHNLAAMPGITNESLTTKLVNTCEARADSLAIIDLPDIYIPTFQKSCKNFKDRVDNTTPEKTAKALTLRQINSSYGATYYPWVKIKDEEFNRDVWCPPSVVALGVMAHTQNKSEIWFAPAGFNRGGLNQGNAGVPVLQVSEQLLSRDRDILYQASINPVASFVSEGIVIFGQKTLQTTQSALDRINVRRLLLFVKKEVSRISNALLFEQNVRATWKKFLNKVVPFLESVKVRFGLTDFKVILDETTTTPDLIDRNIMYAKIFLKPARSIEFIAVDFVITNTGASFAD